MIYVDMDGVIAKWKTASLKELNTRGYFLNREPMENMILAIKILLANKEEITILSAVLNDWAIEEKQQWLSIHLPEIDKEHMFFVPPGISKSDYISIKSDDDTLIDDFSKNLLSWHGIGIKVLNGINGNYGSWSGNMIDANNSPENIADNIMKMIYGRVSKKCS